MSWLRPIVPLAFILALGACTRAPMPGDVLPPKRSASYPQVSPLAASGLPVPPRQGEAWIAPETSLPDTLLTSTSVLFAQGLADPRGCEYREVTVVAGNVGNGGNAAAVKTHGFVLPGEQFVVGWNGLVLRASKVGQKADLHADIEAILAADSEARDAWAEDGPFHRQRTSDEAVAVSHRSFTILKAVLLLRLHEIDLAERYLEAFETEDNDRDLEDPYLLLAYEWLGALFDRGVTAHMRGDHALALASFRPLHLMADAVEAECRRREPHRDQCLDFLQQLPALIADQERRAKEPDVSPPEGVALLIERLDEVAARQWMQPGGVNLSEDPIVQALIDQGDVAVEPLIDVLENDLRLTRSVHYHRDFMHYRTVLGVQEAAYVALVGILETSFFDAESTGDDLTGHGMEGRRAVAKKVRAHWTKWKGVGKEERWYRALADDAAKPSEWVDAAENIAHPTNVTVLPSSMAFTTTWTKALAPGEAPALRGEPLREKTSPSVSALLAKRIESLAADTSSGCALAEAFGRWDVTGARPSLAKQVARAIAASKSSPNRAKFGRCIASLTLQRMDAKDARALHDYARWIKGTRPTYGADYEEWLEPMWSWPTKKPIVAAAEAMFGGESAWVPLVRTGRDDAMISGLVDLLRTPMVKVPGYRKRVLLELEDSTRVGKMKMSKNGRYHIKTDAGGSSGGVADEDDPLAPDEGATSVVRACDVLAEELARRDKAPKFRVYWPKASRDQAITALRAFLQKL